MKVRKGKGDEGIEDKRRQEEEEEKGIFYRMEEIARKGEERI